MGKIVAIVIGIFIVAIMAFMLSSTAPVSSQKDLSRPEFKASDFEKKSSKQNEENIQIVKEDEELKKIKQLQNSVSLQESGVSKQYERTCAPCHGHNGKGVMAPDLTNKSKDEILVKLKDYKANKIQNSLMKGLLTNVSDSDLELLADEISKFKDKK
jgi:hypothetical protein